MFRSRFWGLECYFISDPSPELRVSKYDRYKDHCRHWFRSMASHRPGSRSPSPVNRNLPRWRMPHMSCAWTARVSQDDSAYMLETFKCRPAMVWKRLSCRDPSTWNTDRTYQSSFQLVSSQLLWSSMPYYSIEWMKPCKRQIESLQPSPVRHFMRWAFISRITTAQERGNERTNWNLHIRMQFEIQFRHIQSQESFECHDVQSNTIRRYALSKPKNAMTTDFELQILRLQVAMVKVWSDNLKLLEFRLSFWITFASVNAEAQPSQNASFQMPPYYMTPPTPTSQNISFFWSLFWRSSTLRSSNVASTCVQVFAAKADFPQVTAEAWTSEKHPFLY